MTRTRDVATQGGLVLLNTTTFSAQSSVSINGVFTNTYDNYSVVIYGKGTTTSNLSIRFNLGGTTLTTGYSGGILSATDFSTSPVISQSNVATSLQIGYLYSASYPEFNFEFTAYDVNNVLHQAAISGTGRSSGGPSSGIAANFFGGSRSPGGAIDGITFLTSAGTVTGTIKVYGIRN